MTKQLSPVRADAREERGRQLASSVKIRRVGRRWAVPSQTQPSECYLVNIEDADAGCTCPDFEQRRTVCKHQHAVLFWIAWGCNVANDGSVTETVETGAVKLKRKTYAQKDWRAYDASQVHEKEYVERLLRALCADLPQPERTPGPGRRPLAISDEAYSAVMKIYTRQTNRRVQSDLCAAAERGYLGKVAHYSAMQKFLADPATTPLMTSLVERSGAPMGIIEQGQYAIDSTGFSTAVYDRWFSQKHGQLQSQHTWVKLHVMVGTVTHAVTSAVVTSRSDDSQLPGLLERARAHHHDVRELSADKAYSTHDNHEVLDRLGIEPYIAFQDHAVVNPKYPIWSRHLCEFLLHRDKFAQHYHRRSNVETTFDMIKAKFGAAVTARVPVAQANEVLAKCVAHNLCCMVKAIFTAGLVPTFCGCALVPGRRWRRPCATSGTRSRRWRVGDARSRPRSPCAWRGSPGRAWTSCSPGSGSRLGSARTAAIRPRTLSTRRRSSSSQVTKRQSLFISLPEHVKVPLVPSETIECPSCGGCGRVALYPAAQQALDAVTADWSSTSEVGSRMRRRIKGPALANRLSELRGLGFVESRPAADARALEWRRTSQVTKAEAER